MADNYWDYDGTGLIDHDPWLEPHREALQHRYGHYKYFRDRIQETGGLLGDISSGHLYFGLNRGEKDGQPGVWYREWAPAAEALSLIGDFNNWDNTACPMDKDEYGVWSLFLPDAEYGESLVPGSKVKVHVKSQIGPMDRIPAYIRYTVQDPETNQFSGVYIDSMKYDWQNESPKINGGLRVYEAHIGMATEEEKVGSYTEFTDNILPRIKDLGYNAVQLMAVMEHPYYGSFGYHVSNFFAASSRFGEPDELKRLIDTAHGMGIKVIMDIIHSHTVKNLFEGLNKFDGTEHHYMHGGYRREHSSWDSLCFNYEVYEVQRFLLSNVRFWLEEYKFDGFRFDGVTSMLYIDHGLEKAFTSYEDYFDGNVDRDAVAYLQIANDVAHAVNPDAITIAEDVSGMVGLGRPTEEGGLGFDYRLAMGIPDYWIKLLKHKQDEEWNLFEIYHTLLNRRWNEKHIGYAESHDQALVGDKTIAFWLMDSDMYWKMSKSTPDSNIDRGIALHKLIRMVTFALGGEGYLTFMGNEFGHPEWVDFPREGNGYSFKYARRQWSLPDSDHLRYMGLNQFDKYMQHLDEDWGLQEDKLIEQLAVHEDSRQLVFRRGPLVFAFNFHPTESYNDLRIPIPDACDYTVVLSSDDGRFEGHDRAQTGSHHPWQDVEMYGRRSTQIYLPNRTVLVLAPTHMVQEKGIQL